MKGYNAERAQVALVSDARGGPYVGVHRMAALEFLARLVDHIAERGEVRVRYYGAYASRRRAWWRAHGVVIGGAGAGVATQEHAEEPDASWPALGARRRRWAELLRRVFQIEIEICPRCGGEMHIVGFVLESRAIGRILTHLEWREHDARAGPWAQRAAAAR